MGKSVLMVDDDVDFTESVKAYLEARNYEFRTAHSGADGKKEIDKALPDIILLDVMMDTDADGFNLAFDLKNSETTKNIPIIILSGFTDHLKEKAQSFEFIMGKDWPATTYIKKPASLATIGTTVERLLSEVKPG